MAPNTPLPTPDRSVTGGRETILETLNAARAQGDCETTVFSSPSK